MGEVYRARDARLGRDVAVKVLPADSSADADRLRRFEQEAKAAGALNQPNLLAVFDTGLHDGAPYIVFELLQGETLRGRLDRGPLTVRKAVDYATQIARGLAAAHESGIVHRDLKPENLFLTRDDRVKILDFGLAKLRPGHDLDDARNGIEPASAITAAGTVLGTTGYMSPEQVEGRPVDHRSDIFSFGSVLYEMLAGKRAFKGATVIETLNAILNEDYPELSGTGSPKPPALERIVRRCLEKSPEMRFRSAHDLAFALEGLSAPWGSQSATATGTAPTKSPWPWIGWGLLALALPSVGFLVGRLEADRPVPSFQRLTFRRGTVESARFAPDGRTILYSAAWDGEPIRVFSTRIERPESARVDIPDARLEAVSPSGEMLIKLVSTKCLPPGETQERDVSWFEATSASGLSPDGRTVLLNEVGVASGPGPEVSTYLRTTDGSPPVRLGDGFGMALSPDGRFVLAVSHRNGGWSLLPTGPGEPRPLDFQGLDLEAAAWHPDSRHLFLSSTAQGGRRQRCYTFDINEGKPEPVTPEGVGCRGGPSPDGKTLLAAAEDRRYMTYSLADQQTQTVLGLLKDDEPLAWGEDSRSLFVQRAPLPRAQIDRLDLTTRQRRPWREIRLPDPAGVMAELSGITMAQNGSYCYSYLQVQSDLYLFDGVR